MGKARRFARIVREVLDAFDQTHPEKDDLDGAQHKAPQKGLTDAQKLDALCRILREDGFEVKWHDADPKGDVPEHWEFWHRDGHDMRKALLERKREPIPVASDPEGNIRWDIARTQIRWAADLGAFVLGWWNHLPKADTYEEIIRRALIAVTAFHGLAIEDLPDDMRRETGE